MIRTVITGVAGRMGSTLVRLVRDTRGFELVESTGYTEFETARIMYGMFAAGLVEKCGERLTLLSGDDFTVLPFIACGGKGVISVSSNVAPRMMADLVAAARGGDLKRALELQVRMNALHRLLFVESSPIPVKWALHALGLFGPEVRLPLVPMTEPNARKLEAELRTLGLLKP